MGSQAITTMILFNISPFIYGIGIPALIFVLIAIKRAKPMSSLRNRVWTALLYMVALALSLIVFGTAFSMLSTWFVHRS